ncbi:MAG: radical SAM protein [Candidatus Omnitrophota bacterium]
MKYNIGGIYPLPPLGLAYIASLLEQNGFCVDILDMPALKIKVEDLNNLFKKNQYDAYGISCTIFNLSEGVKIANLIKGINQASRVVLGGHCNAFSSKVIFKYGTGFDVLVRGEGEETMLRLCSLWKKQESDAKLSEISGISFKDNGNIIDTPKPPYLNLDEIPFPARHLLPYRYYKMHPPFNLYSPVTLVETARGCMYNCTFCSISQPLRERPVSKVIEEIKEVIKNFGIREIHFVDPNFTVKPERIIELCNQLIREKIKVAWSCETRINPVSDILLNKMWKAGCYMIAYGVESGSQEVLNYLNKGITKNEIINTFKLTRKSGIRTTAYLMLGLPRENNSTFRETLNLVKRIEPDYVLYTELFPVPNSFTSNQPLGSWQAAEEALAEYYILQKDIFGRNSFAGHPKRTIKRRHLLATISFYFRVKYIFIRLWRLKNIREVFNLLNGTYLLLIEVMNLKSKHVFKR